MSLRFPHHDGDEIPSDVEDEYQRGNRVPLLLWFCPDLTEEEARALDPLLLGTPRLTLEMRTAIERELPGVRAKG
jgi:hypothetical protein